MKKNFTLTFALLLYFFYIEGNAQTQFWSDTFEDSGAPSSSTRVPSVAEFSCNSPATVYFFRTIPTGVALQNGTYSGFQGSKIWAAEDIDKGTSCTTNSTISPNQQITWSGINITGKTGLTFKGLFAADNIGGWQGQFFAPNQDFVSVEYRINGTGAWIKAIAFYANIAATNAGSTNTLDLDTDGDLIGDGAALNYAFTEYSATIVGTGTTLDIRLNCSANGSTTQEIAIDNFRLFEAPASVAPTVTTAAAATVGSLKATLGGNVTADGGASVTERGIVWATTANPTTSNTKVTNGTGTGSFSAIISSLPAGTFVHFRAYAINSAGTSYGSDLTFTTNAALSASNSQTNVSCNGGSNGTASVTTSGGVISYSYSWSPSGGTGATATGLVAGAYICTITDNESTQINKNFTITQPAAITATTAQTQVSCNGGSNGTASVNASGGTGTLTYLWSPSGGTAATATGLAAGAYTCTISDDNTCFITKNFTITQPAAITATTAQTQVSCNGGSNGTASVNASGGTGTLTYLWSPSGGTAATATGLAAGAYTCTISDDNTCFITKNFTITQPAAITATTAQTQVSCNGGSNGTASVTASGGTGTLTYLWSPSGGTAATATGLAAGAYTCTISDDNTCFITKNFTITQPAAITATTAQTQVSCNGGSNGTASVTASGGTGTLTYSWSPSGGTAATATGLAAGAYTCTISDDNTCFITKNFTITQPAAITATTAQTQVSCNGGSNGSASVTASGGTGTLTYSWSPSGGTAATATGLAAGAYTCTISDDNTCFITKNFTITQPAAITATTAQTQVSCNGGSNGSASVTASGGTGTLTYLWSPSGGTAATATGLAAGAYTCTISDDNTCFITKNFTITQPAAITATTAQTQVSCNGGSNGTASVTASGGTGTLTYLWSPSGGTAATATGLAAGAYTCTISDDNTCFITKNFTITQPAAITATTAQTQVSCNGGSNGTASVTASGGTGTLTYLWSPSGGTAATATGLAAGAYTCTISDDNTCFITKNFTITQPAAITATTAQTQVSCNGGSNGTASVTASGGTGTLTYLWSPSGGTAATATGLAAGAYTCTISDDNTCFITKNFTITQPAAITATTAQTQVSCNGGSNGSASVTASGGTGTLTYSWSPSGGTAATATGLAAGAYTCTISDDNTCFITKNFTITQPAAITATTAQTQVSCNGGSNGTASVTASGGTGTLTYSWSPSGGTAATATGLAAGAYTCTISDDNTCFITKNFTITQPAAITATTAQTQVSCNGGSNGSASVTASGGTGTLTYSWSPSGGTAATATGLAAGAYTCTISDDNTCFITKNFTITQPAAITATTAQTQVSCNGGSNGSASVTASGGTGTLTYLWSPSGGTAATATGLAAGAYICTISDDNTCFITKNFTITQPAAITATTAQTQVSCNGGSNGSASVTASGGTGTLTYLWSPSGGTAATATGLAAGAYTCTISDDNTCFITKNFTITQPAAITATTAQTQVSCNGGSNGTASVTASGGTGTLTYLWSPSGGTAATATGLAAGAYTCTISDDNTCFITKNFTITQPAAITATTAQTQVSCNGGSNGTASVTASGGTGTLTYSWSPSGGTAATATGLAAGAYTCTISDDNTCFITKNFTITQPAAITATTAQTQVSCNGGSNGSASVTASGGTGTLTYLWSPSGGTAATATGLAAGAYICTISDDNTCFITKNFTITQPAAITATTAQTQVSCNGGSNGTASVNASGGTGTLTYVWSPSGGTAATATGLAAGAYSCTISDDNTCFITKNFTITEPAAITATTAQTQVSCNGGSNGTASVNASGGTGTLTYVWSPSGGTAATATGLAAGAYSCTISDDNTCFITKNFTITEPAAITATTAQTQVSCNGGSNGTASVNASGGTGTLTYVWSPSGGTAATATGLAAGAYSCTISDDNTCFITKNFTITQPAAITATTAQTQVSCNGGSNGTASVNASGGTGTLTYLWSPSGGTAATATGLAAGAYSCTISDDNTCFITKNFTITQPAAITATTAQTQVSCNGGSNGTASVNASGGTGTLTYVWSPSGGTAATATGLAAGAYSCTISDDNTCFITKNFTITQPAAITATTAQTQVSCNGGSNGSASVTASGGTGTLTYLWSPSGGTAATATGLAAGAYTCTISDDNTCFITKNFTITQPAAITATTAQTQVSCNGGSNGTASVTASGGTGTLTYLWSPSGGTAATATGLAAGAYTCTISDDNTCFITKNFTITQPAAITATTAQTQVSCNGGSNGTASVTASGGTGTLTYSWSPSGGTAATATGLAAGAYTCTISDDNTCFITKNFTITQPAAITATTAQTQVSCNGGSNGSASVTASGGTGTLTYLWSPSGGTAATATGLAAGAYICTISDDNTCFITKNFTITQPAAITATTAQTQVSCNGGSNGTASVNASGGTGTLTYVWSPSGGTAATATGLAAGAYSCTISDDNTCFITKNFTITEPAAITATTAQTQVSCNGGSNGTASVNASGGTGTLTYVWSPSGGTAATATGLAAGAYSCTISDDNTCFITKNFTITEPAAITATTAQTQVSCNGGSNGTASVNASGGTGTLTYVWSPSGGTAATATGLAAGAYSCTISDDNTCFITKNFTITEPTAITATTAQTQVSCNGGSNGTASVNASGGTGTLTYLWSPSGGTAATATGLAAGAYSCTISDDNTCFITKNFTITQPAAITATTAQTQVSCNGGSNGTASVNASGGTGTLTYVWSPSGGTAATATGLAAGAYSCTISDDNTCFITKNFTITQPAAITATTAQTQVSCNGGSNGTASVNASGGTGTLTYVWSPSGGTAATATGLAAGAYSCTISDDNTCFITKNFTITQPAAITATTAQTQVSCNGGSNGTASVNASGGTGTLTYLWSPSGGTAATATGLAAGAYSCTISDDNTCFITKNFTITEPVPFSSTTTLLGYDYNSLYSQNIVVTGGTGIKTYAITTGSLPSGLSLSSNGEIAGTSTQITDSNFTVTVTDGNNCTAAYNIVLKLNQIPITVKAIASQTKIYGQNDPVLTYTVTPSLLSGDSFSGSLTRVTGENIGDYAISQGSLSAGSKYLITYVGADFSITAKPITVTADASQTKIYGMTDPVFAYSISSSLVSGDTFTGDLKRVAGENAGTYAIEQGSLSAGSNYTITYVSKDFSITAKPITVTADASQTKIYGTTDPVFAYSISSSLVSGDTFTGDLTRVAGENVGTYAIEQGSLSAGSNYTITYVSKDFAITAKPITVTATASQTKVYKTADTVFTYSVLPSLVSGDTFTGDLTRVAGENVGAYAIEQGSLDAGSNYIISYVGDDFAITAIPITITVDASQTKVYGTTDPVFVYSFTPSLISGDTFTGSLTRITGENVGTYAIEQGMLSAGTNYTITYVGANFSVTAKPITVSADASQTKAYGTTDPAFAYSVSPSLVSGDTFTGALTRESGENVGIYAIEQGTLGAGANYTVTYVGENFSITKADQTISWNQTLQLGCDGVTTAILTATSSSGLPISYISSNPSLVTVSNGSLIFQNYGFATITASQQGNNNYNPASIVVLPAVNSQPNLIKKHFENVIFFDNSSKSFKAYSWYKNGVLVPNQTSQYFKENGPLNGTYYAIATKLNGTLVNTCPLTFSPTVEDEYIKIVPNPAKSNSNYQLVTNVSSPKLQNAHIQVYSIGGLLMEDKITSENMVTLKAPGVEGIYIVRMTLANGQYFTKNLLVKN
ncbi:MBG domain-containing protein [Flavobacterium sp. 5]|uniref:MBG domain-containing protein n=1 Tax=Flavobacterium sp. 5 TaxID=2035199 RepID=UPI000C2C312B|nr:MBG domain-containing protein [Flavobacterium sp. 5]PKB17719.1 SprB-like repeat protein [Flavobacterium sp. 5]